MAIVIVILAATAATACFVCKKRIMIEGRMWHCHWGLEAGVVYVFLFWSMEESILQTEARSYRHRE
jgi:hypothetical protein